MELYFGTYQTFEAYSKEAAGSLMSADCLVGDLFDIRLDLEEGQHRAILVNRFGHEVGIFDHSFARKLGISCAGGMKVKALLSYVAFTEEEKGGRYWGEAAVFGYAPSYEDVFLRFIGGVGEKIQENVRPRIDFDREGIEKILDSNGAWVPEQNLPLPAKERGTVIMKDHRTLCEKLIEQGRAKNKGCYFVSWAFIILLIAALVGIVYSFLN